MANSIQEKNFVIASQRIFGRSNFAFVCGMTISLKNFTEQQSWNRGELCDCNKLSQTKIILTSKNLFICFYNYFSWQWCERSIDIVADWSCFKNCPTTFLLPYLFRNDVAIIINSVWCTTSHGFRMLFWQSSSCKKM